VVCVAEKRVAGEESILLTAAGARHAGSLQALGPAVAPWQYRDLDLLKVRAAVSNARAFLAVQKEFGSFDTYIWRFVGGKPVRNHHKTIKDIPATSPESDALSKDPKKRGFKFVGSIIIYAHHVGGGHGERPWGQLFPGSNPGTGPPNAASEIHIPDK